MIVRASLENWMSFRKKATLSMIATRERQHGDRVLRLGKYRTRLLPIAAMYGGNASGKTNFCQGLKFAQGLIVHGTQPDGLIPVETFKLDDKMAYEPSRICFELLIGDIIYEFSFAATRRQILEEKLVVINGSSENVLYNRRDDKPNFGKSLKGDRFLEFVFQGTRDNQLFLTNAVSQNVKALRPVYNWFKYRLTFIVPNTSKALVEPLLAKGNPLDEAINRRLEWLDTGIARLGGIDLPLENIPMMDEQLRFRLENELNEGGSVQLQVGLPNQRFVVSRKDGELVAKRLFTYHHTADGKETRFDFSKEASGLHRLTDLLPALSDLESEGSTSVYVIDEFDRSLHTLLTRRLLEAYLSSCTKETRSQLLLNTHDVMLMDQGILRRDEMWVVERDYTGASSLFSFSEYRNVRYDKDIRKSYLTGRLGGVPRTASLSDVG